MEIEKSVEHGNKLIAEFMGAKFNEKYPTIIYHEVNGNSIHYIYDLKYHSSWDWLMPVVEKIEKYKYDDNDGTDRDYNFAYLRTFQGHMVRINRFPLTFGETKIEALWFSVIGFIKWFNECQKQKA